MSITQNRSVLCHGEGEDQIEIFRDWQLEGLGLVMGITGMCQH